MNEPNRQWPERGDIVEITQRLEYSDFIFEEGAQLKVLEVYGLGDVENASSGFGCTVVLGIDIAPHIFSVRRLSFGSQCRLYQKAEEVGEIHEYSGLTRSRMDFIAHGT